MMADKPDAAGAPHLEAGIIPQGVVPVGGLMGALLTGAGSRHGEAREQTRRWDDSRGYTRGAVQQGFAAAASTEKNSAIAQVRAQVRAKN